MKAGRQGKKNQSQAKEREQLVRIKSKEKYSFYERTNMKKNSRKAFDTSSPTHMSVNRAGDGELVVASALLLTL